MAQQIDDFVVPYGYEIWADGVYRKNGRVKAEAGTATEPIEPTIFEPAPKARFATHIRVSNEPLFITRFARSEDDQEALIEVACREGRHRALFTRWIPRSLLASKTALATLLARYGFPLDAENARDVIIYLREAISTNPSLPEVKAGKRSGRYVLPENRYGFLLGEDWIGPEGTDMIPHPSSFNGPQTALVSRGELRPWLDMLRSVLSISPLARWLIMSTFAPPLMRFVPSRTFVIHHWGKSSVGKTATARFAMSAWGDPMGLENTFNSTEKAFIEIFRTMTDLPALFDEAQARDEHLNVGRLVMALCLEQGRRRLNTSGDLGDTLKSWRSIVRFTGEEPIIGADQIDLGGQANRVLQVNVAPCSEEQAIEMHQFCQRGNHFGVAGRAFVRALIDEVNEHGTAKLVDFYERAQLALAAQASISRQRRDHLAVIALGHAFAAHWLLSSDLDAALHGATRDAISVAGLLASDETSTPHFEVVLDWLRQRRSSARSCYVDPRDYRDRDRAVKQNVKIEGLLMAAAEGAGRPSNEIWYFPSAINPELLRAGFRPRRVWRDLLDAGWLVASGEPNLAPVRKLPDGSSARVYVVRKPLAAD